MAEENRVEAGNLNSELESAKLKIRESGQDSFVLTGEGIKGLLIRVEGLPKGVGIDDSGVEIQIGEEAIVVDGSVKLKLGILSPEVVKFDGYTLGISPAGELERKLTPGKEEPDYVVKIPRVSLPGMNLKMVKEELERGLTNPQEFLDERYRELFGITDAMGKYSITEGKLYVTVQSPARLAKLAAEAAKAAERPRDELEGLKPEELEELCRGVAGNFIVGVKSYPDERVGERERLLVLEDLCRMVRSFGLIGKRIGDEKVQSIVGEEFERKGGLSGVDVGSFDRILRDSGGASGEWKDKNLLEALAGFQAWLREVKGQAAEKKGQAGAEVEAAWRRMEEELGKYPGVEVTQERRLRSLQQLAVAAAEFRSKGGAMTVERDKVWGRAIAKGTVDVLVVDTNEALNGLQAALERPGLTGEREGQFKTTLAEVLELREVLVNYVGFGTEPEFRGRTEDVRRWLEGEGRRIGPAREGKGLTDREAMEIMKRAREMTEISDATLEALMEAWGQLTMRHGLSLPERIEGMDVKGLWRELWVKFALENRITDSVERAMTGVHREKLMNKGWVSADKLETLRRYVVFGVGLTVMLKEPVGERTARLIDEALEIFKG